MNTDKIAALIGFAKKAGSCIMGSEAVKRNRKIAVLFLCRTAAPNTTKEVKAKAKRENIPLIMPTHTDLAGLVHKENCKTAGVSNGSLAKGIIENLQNNENYLLLNATGGTN